MASTENLPSERDRANPAGLAQGLHLFAMIWLATSIGLSWRTVSIPELVSALHLAFFIHIGLSLYIGVSGATRTATWLALIAAFVGAHAATFLGYLMPWGQFGYWLAGALTQVVGISLAEMIVELGSTQSKLWPAMGFAAIGADVVALHGSAWRRRPLAAFALVAAAVATAVLAELAFERFGVEGPDLNAADSEAFPSILPAWHALPFYAILRAVPDKLGGIIVMFGAMLAPIVWPWARAETLRVDRLKWGWRLACVVAALAWAGLWVLGATPPVEPWLAVSLALTVVWFIFILSPFAFRRLEG